jgi:hypothetical protein
MWSKDIYLEWATQTAETDKCTSWLYKKLAVLSNGDLVSAADDSTIKIWN